MEGEKFEIESEAEFNDLFQLEEIVNRDVFRTTYRAHSKKTGDQFYCKRLDASNMPETQFSSFISNMFSISSLHEKGYLSLKSICILQKRKVVYLITPDYGLSSLAHWISETIQKQTFFEESLIWRMLAQISVKLYALHFPGNHGIRPGRRFVHCQLKPSNIFLDDEMNVFLTDPMGVSFASYCWSASEGEVLRYIPNEAITANTLKSKIDIYALGCVLYELCTLTPYPVQNFGRNHSAALQETHYSSQLKTLIVSLLNPYADGRPSARDLVDDSTVKQYIKYQQACTKLRLPSPKRCSYANIAHDLQSMAEENETSSCSPRSSPRGPRTISPSNKIERYTDLLSFRSSVAFSPSQPVLAKQVTVTPADTTDQGTNTIVETKNELPDEKNACELGSTRKEHPLNLFQDTPNDYKSLKNYCRFLENEVASLRSDLVIAESLKHKYNDELTSTRIQLMKYVDSEASLKLGTEDLVERGDASCPTLEKKIKDLEIQLSMERANTFILRRENAKLVEYLRNIDVTMTTCAEQRVDPMEMVDQVRSNSIATRRKDVT